MSTLLPLLNVITAQWPGRRILSSALCLAHLLIQVFQSTAWFREDQAQSLSHSGPLYCVSFEFQSRELRLNGDHSLEATLHMSGDFSKTIIILGNQKAMLGPSDSSQGAGEGAVQVQFTHVRRIWTSSLIFALPSLSLFFFFFFWKEYAGHVRELDWSMLSLCIIGSNGPQGERRDSFLRTLSWIPLWSALPPLPPTLKGGKWKEMLGSLTSWGYIIERGCSSSWVVPSSPNLASWIEMNV